MKDRHTPEPQLKGVIGPSKFFTLAFGAIIGVGWIVMLGDWLGKAGPIGAIAAFLAGGLLMTLVALSYAEMATMLPVSGGEVAYTYEVYGVPVCFATGWFLALSYIAFTSFEAISAAWVVDALVPGMTGATLYRSLGAAVKADSLVLGLTGMIAITLLNLRGVKEATTAQELLTYGKIACAAVFITAGILWGKTSHLVPLVQVSGGRTNWAGLIAVFVTTPVWFAGFNVIPQVMEEKAPGTSWRTIGRVFGASIISAALFYCLLILSASMSVPWTRLLVVELPAADAFRAAFHSAALAKLVLMSALLGLVGTWNAVFIAASRVLFALGRAKIIHPPFGVTHPARKTPTRAIVFVGLLGSCGVLLGRNAIAPIVNVGATCFGLVFFLTCFGVIKMRRNQPRRERPFRVPGGILSAGTASVVSGLMFLVSLYEPYRASNRTFPLEWKIVLGWAILGVLFWTVANRGRKSVSEPERRRSILGLGASAP
ncbi:MAG TPA: APC family permease [Terriglobales bacterium]|nr:APC family permease [Terriglobales bacterium]